MPNPMLRMLRPEQPRWHTRGPYGRVESESPASRPRVRMQNGASACNPGTFFPDYEIAGTCHR
jgi:hypothetical protein